MALCKVDAKGILPVHQSRIGRLKLGMTQKRLGLLAVTASALGSSQLASLAKVTGYRLDQTYTVLTGRFWLAAFFLMILSRRLPTLSRKQALLGFLMGASGFAMSALCFFWALLDVPTSVASVLLFTFPAMVLVLDSVLSKTRPSLAALVGIILAVSGTSLLAGLTLGAERTIGIWYGLGSAFFYAGYLIAGRKLLSNGVASLDLGIVAMLGAAFVVTILAFHQGSAPLALEQWPPLMTMSLVATALPVFLMLYAVASLGSVRASTLSTLEPILAAMTGLLFWGENLSPIQCLGVALVVGSVVVSIFSERQADGE